MGRDGRPDMGGSGHGPLANGAQPPPMQQIMPSQAPQSPMQQIMPSQAHQFGLGGAMLQSPVPPQNMWGGNVGSMIQPPQMAKQPPPWASQQVPQNYNEMNAGGIEGPAFNQPNYNPFGYQSPFQQSPFGGGQGMQGSWGGLGMMNSPVLAQLQQFLGGQSPFGNTQQQNPWSTGYHRSLF